MCERPIHNNRNAAVLGPRVEPPHYRTRTGSALSRYRRGGLCGPSHPLLNDGSTLPTVAMQATASAGDRALPPDDGTTRAALSGNQHGWPERLIAMRPLAVSAVVLGLLAAGCASTPQSSSTAPRSTGPASAALAPTDGSTTNSSNTQTHPHARACLPITVTSGAQVVNIEKIRTVSTLRVTVGEHVLAEVSISCTSTVNAATRGGALRATGAYHWTVLRPGTTTLTFTAPSCQLTVPPSPGCAGPLAVLGSLTLIATAK